ncbi:hypothetical protein CEXT_501551 [Caerostris extrusa]|uniref:Secreted protein n=1 Tax=Caerostris extrusa TaxID=172846 RepID=A0AAV4R3H1_CAEEX|nr:hypothetical protein CEXT_501551 [Caerostris extrusa]
MAFFFCLQSKAIYVSLFQCCFVSCGAAPCFSLGSGAAATSPKKLSRRALNLQERIRINAMGKYPYPIFLENCCLRPHTLASFFSFKYILMHIQR